VYGSRLLCERTQCRRAYLAFDAAAICVDAEAVFLYVFFVVSRPRFLSGRIVESNAPARFTQLLPLNNGNCFPNRGKFVSIPKD
jgi:hypothetical protein